VGDQTLEAQTGQFLLDCKCPVTRFLPGRAKDLSASRYFCQSFSDIRKVSLVATSPLCLVYANEEKGKVSHNTTLVFGGAIYLG
jgi:hypothetical protein